MVARSCRRQQSADTRCADARKDGTAGRAKEAEVVTTLIRPVVTTLDAHGYSRRLVFGDCENCEREIFAPVEVAQNPECWTHYKGDDLPGELMCNPRYTLGKERFALADDWTLNRAAGGE